MFSIKDQSDSFLEELGDLMVLENKSVFQLKFYELIVRYQVSLDEPINQHGWTILHWVCHEMTSYGELQNLDALIEIYKKQEISLEIEDPKGLTPLVQSISNNQSCITSLLLSHGASPDFVSSRGFSGAIAFEGSNLNPTSESLDELVLYEQTFCDAIHPGHVKRTVKRMLTWFTPPTDCLIHPMDGQDRTLLHLAIRHKAILPDLRFIANLYKQHHSIDIEDTRGESALMLAIDAEDLQGAQLLIEYGASLKEVNLWGDTPLDKALECPRDSIFKLIYEATPDNLRSQEAHTRYNKLNNSAQRPPARSTTRPLTAQQKANFMSKYQSYELGPPRPPKSDGAMVPEKTKAWVNLHPDPYYQALAQKIIDHTQYVSYDDFREQLKLSTLGFNEALATLPEKARNYVLVLPEETNKSNPWVFSHAIDYLVRLPSGVIRINELNQYLKQHRGPKPNLLFVDDASYSGTQMKQEMVDVAYDMAASLAKPVNLYCIIPFMTAHSRQTIARHADVYIAPSKHMPTIRELNIFTSEEKKTLRSHNINSADPDTKRHLNWPELTMTYFQHKIADYKSTLCAILSTGRSIHDMNIRKPFIAPIAPPYKLVKPKFWPGANLSDKLEHILHEIEDASKKEAADEAYQLGYQSQTSYTAWFKSFVDPAGYTSDYYLGRAAAKEEVERQASSGIKSLRMD